MNKEISNFKLLIINAILIITLLFLSVFLIDIIENLWKGRNLVDSFYDSKEILDLFIDNNAKIL